MVDLPNNVVTVNDTDVADVVVGERVPTRTTRPCASGRGWSGPDQA